MRRLRKSSKEDISKKNSDVLCDYGVKAHKKRLNGYTYILAYGGGLNSTAMVIDLINKKFPIDYVVFADPGFERPETYDFINNHFLKWMTDHRVKFVTVARYKDGKRQKITDYFIDQNRVPDQVYRDCTIRHKIENIHKFYSRQLKTKYVVEYMGIHAEEQRRVRASHESWIHKCYPLVEFGIGKKECEDIIRGEGLPIPVKSGCPNCFANNRATYYKLYKEHPDMFDKSIEIEESFLKYKEDKGLKPFYYMRIDGKPMRLLDLKKQFEALKDDPNFDESEQTSADNDCVGGCMT